MRVIGVVDLLGGRAVHARAGQRERYAPVRAIAGRSIEPGDAVALAREYVDRLGLAELYAADLDAILSGRHHDGTTQMRLPGHEQENVPSRALQDGSQDTMIAAVAALGAPLWLDAGVSCAAGARQALALGAARVVVGLETLRSYDGLAEICAAVGRGRVAFSLDLRESEPVLATGERGGIAPGEPAHAIAARAAAAGAGAVIVIDLARVGTGRGLDLELIARVRDWAPGLTLLAGGGVRGIEDLVRLADAGCDGALVATALHNGRLGAADVAACISSSQRPRHR